MSVVVGVDGSAACRTAIRLAAQEARYRQAQLIAIMTYGRERVLGAPASQPVATLTTVDYERSAKPSRVHREKSSRRFQSTRYCCSAMRSSSVSAPVSCQADCSAR